MMANLANYPSIEEMLGMVLESKDAEDAMKGIIDIITNPSLPKPIKARAILKCVTNAYFEHGKDPISSTPFKQVELFDDKKH